MRPIAATLHLAATSLLAASLAVQVYLAGRGVFEDPRLFVSHRDLGYTIGLLALIVVPIALAAGAGRAQVGRAALAVAMVALQSVLVLARADLPSVAALHPVNGFLIFGLSLIMVRAAWRGRPARARLTTRSAGR